MLQDEDALVVGLEVVGGETQLCFRRVVGGCAAAGAEALAAELAAVQESSRAATAATTATAASSSSTVAAAPAGASVSKGNGVAMSGMGARPLKFDPLKKVSQAAESGADISGDGGAARADPDTLPTDAGS